MMKKRLLSVCLAAALLLTGILPAAAAVETGWIMFVYTENHGTLNVRSSMTTGNNVIGVLNYGAAVHVYTFYSGWALIEYNNSTAYVMSRYLVYNQPTTPVVPTPTPAPAPAPSDTSLNEINSEFRTAVRVAQPYRVISRPSRASGWVNLRWAPSTQAERITTCPQGKELLVLSELRNWYQVQDPVTGMVGFISRAYVTAQ